MKLIKKSILTVGAALLVTSLAAPMASAAEPAPGVGGEKPQYMKGAATPPALIPTTGQYDPSLDIFPTPGLVQFTYELNLNATSPEQVAGITGVPQGEATWRIYEVPNFTNGSLAPAAPVLFDTGTVTMIDGTTTVTSSKPATIDPAEVKSLANIRVINFWQGNWDAMSKNYYLSLDYAGNENVQPFSTDPNYLATSVLNLPGKDTSNTISGAPCLPANQTPHPSLAGQEINYCPTRPRPTPPPVVVPEPVVETPAPVVETPAPVVVEEPVVVPDVVVETPVEKKAQPLIETGFANEGGTAPSAALLGLGVLGIFGAAALTLTTIRKRNSGK